MWKTWLFQYANPLRVSCDIVGQNQVVGTSNRKAVHANDRNFSGIIELPVSVKIKIIPEFVGAGSACEPISDEDRGAGSIEKVQQVLEIVCLVKRVTIRITV